MVELRKRRIVRRAALTVAGVVLLLNGYVVAFIGTRWAVSHGHFGMAAGSTPVFAPLNHYGGSDLPGGRDFAALTVWCCADGRIPLTKIRDQLDRIADQRDRAVER